MLSRKQQWRHTRVPAHRADAKDVDGVYDSVDDDEGGDVARDSMPSSSLAAGHFGGSSGAPPKKLRSALNLYAMLTEAEKASNPRPKDTRSMRFSSTVHICLIPSREELRQQVLELFWKPEDYVTFKQDAVHELRVFLTANGITAKEAIFQLYQPHDHERQQWMKEFEESLQEKEGGETDRESASTNAEDYNSEDDDEPRYGRPDDEGLKKIFANVKTDVELNAGSSDHKPVKTPSAGEKQGQSMWAVQWKRAQGQVAEHK